MPGLNRVWLNILGLSALYEGSKICCGQEYFLQLWLIAQLAYLDKKCLATVVHAVVISKADYNALYTELPLTIQKL